MERHRAQAFDTERVGCRRARRSIRTCRVWRSEQGSESGGVEFPCKYRWPVVVCEAGADENVPPILFEQTKARDESAPSATGHEYECGLNALGTLPAILLLGQGMQSPDDLFSRPWREFFTDALQEAMRRLRHPTRMSRPATRPEKCSLLPRTKRG